VITPRLYRRSLGHAFQARILVLFVLGTLIPTILAILPLRRALSALLDHSPRAKELVAALDSHAAIDLLRQLGDAQTRSAVGGGFVTAIAAALLVAPFLAGAALLVARAEEPAGFRALLGSAGENYGRMLRVALVGLVPLGLAVAASGAFFVAAHHRAERALTESDAVGGARLAMFGTAVLVYVAQLLLDAARAMFAAQPYRKSALLAFWAGVRIVVRRPLRSLGLGFATLVVGFGVSGALLLLRLRLPQAGPGTVFLAFVLAQLAAAGFGWHRTARIVGFAELARADAAERERRSALATLPPPAPAPATPVPALGTRSAVLDALAPPVSVPAPIDANPA